MARLTLILGVLATVVYLLDGFRFLLNEWRRWRNRGTWLAVVVVCFLPVSSWALDSTTVGTLTTSETFDTIWIKSTYTDDGNSTNSFVLEYKLTSSGTWLNAYAPPPDRRATVAGGTDNTANRYQFRAGVFGLTSGQTYDVRVTYVDTDGVTGGPTLSSTVTLLSDATVQRSGSTYYLDDVGSNGDGSSGSPFNTFANAFAGTACGDRLIVRDGTYAAFTFSKTCTSTSWYVIEAEIINGPSISDAATQVISVAGNFVKLTGLKIPTATCSGIRIETNNHDVWIDYVTIEDVGTTVTTIGHIAAYGCNGIRIQGGTYHIYITNNTVHGLTLTTFGPPASHGDTCCNGIGGESAAPSATGVFVYKGNTVTGSFRDAIGNSPESASGGANWSDIINNTVTNFVDDGIQMEGGDIGLLVQGNVVNSDNAYACFAAQTGYFGPIYWIRNTCRLTWSVAGGYAWKAGGLQFGFFFHNSVQTLNAPHDGITGTTDTSYLLARNNIIKVAANPLADIYDTGTNLDYNLYYRASGTTLARRWNGVTDYTLATFQGIGQETHGLFVDPGFIDTALHINAASPAHDAGVSIANINDATSAWPSDGAPDMGAFEFIANPIQPVIVARVLRWMGVALPVLHTVAQYYHALSVCIDTLVFFVTSSLRMKLTTVYYTTITISQASRLRNLQYRGRMV